MKSVSLECAGVFPRSNSLLSWLMWPRTKHSKKPDAMYTLIEEASPGPYLELFARERRPGWAAWGNEV